MGRPTISASGKPLSAKQRMRRLRTRRANEQKREATKAKQESRRARLAATAIRPTGTSIWSPGDPERFTLILIDPPWETRTWSDAGKDRSAERHYPTMPIDEICALQIPAADNCVMYCWRTAPHAAQAQVALTAWGFAYQSEHIWIKTDSTGKPWSATGRWNRNQHEVLMVATRGAIPCPAPGEQFPSVIFAPRGEHSAKPEIFYEMLEALFPNVARLEMFARTLRTGWTSHGNELRGISPGEEGHQAHEQIPHHQARRSILARDAPPPPRGRRG